MLSSISIDKAITSFASECRPCLLGIKIPDEVIINSISNSHTGRKALDDGEVGDAEAFVLIETSGGKREHDEAKLETLLEALYESSLPSDSSVPLLNSGTQSQSLDQFHSLWSFRELLPEAASKSGKVYKYDVSVPVAKFKEVTEAVRARLMEEGVMRKEGEEGGEAKVKEVVGYGHFGDGMCSFVPRLSLLTGPVGSGRGQH